MSNPTTMPSDVAARTGAAIRSLTAVQLADLMASSQQIQKRVLPLCWDVVKTADPALAEALDELHFTSVEQDMPRFDALAAQHVQAIARSVKEPAGRATAGLIVGALIIGTLTLLASLAGTTGPAVTAWGLLAAGMLIAGLATGRRVAALTGNWMFANAGLAACTVWDAGIDAAAATALASRAGTAGLTPDVLRALTAVWTRAGLDTALLVPAPIVVEAPVPAKPAVKRAPRTRGATPAKRPVTARPVAPKASPAKTTAAPAAPKRPAVKRTPATVSVASAASDPSNVPKVKVPVAV
ncbi:MAG TPA: hypothetical protein VF867_14125 [Arthrobacter sp.]